MHRCIGCATTLSLPKSYSLLLSEIDISRVGVNSNVGVTVLLCKNRTIAEVTVTTIFLFRPKKIGQQFFYFSISREEKGKSRNYCRRYERRVLV